MAEVCGARVTIFDPVQGPIDVSLPDFGDLVDRASYPPSQDPDEGVEEWNELVRETSQIEVGGVTISRIDSVTFEKPSGSKVKLIFNN